MPLVTLTFDNGPSPETTPFVLDVLRDRGLAAWFCVVGRMVEAEGGAELVRRTLAEGHRVANHSSSHHTPLGEDPSECHARSEVTDAGHRLDDLIDGWDAGERWYRPFGRGGLLGPHVFSPAALAAFAAEDYSVLLWNSIPRDWVDIDSWPTAAREQIAEHEHTVTVLHDQPTGAMAHLPSFLDGLMAEGVEFTLDLPDDCIPVRRGVPCFDLTGLTAAVG